jgi:hypothetical protein
LVNVRLGEDRALIILSHKPAVRYWTRELGCTRAELRAAIRAVGRIAANVRAHISGAQSQAIAARRIYSGKDGCAHVGNKLAGGS